MSQKIYNDLEINGGVKVTSIPNATSDTDKFLVSDGGTVKYRTGAEMLSDLGVAPGVASNIQHQVKAAVAINKGQAVYVSSADGTNIIVSLASNATEATSSKTMGLLDSTVSINGFANVIAEGLLAGLNTSTAIAGDPVWLGTNGNLIYGLTNKPYAPAHLVFIGIVTRVNANNGEIFVKVQNGFELDELHDVDLKSITPINGHILGHNGTLWVNKTIAGWLGYTPANDSNVVHKTGSETITGTKTFSGSRIYFSNSDFAQIQLESVSTPGSFLKLGTSSNNANLFSSGAFDFRVGGLTSSALIIASNENATFKENLTAKSFIKSGGTSSQFLKADGTVDSNTYLTSYSETDTLATVTARGASTSNQITLSGGGDNSNTYSSVRFAGYNQGGGVGYHGFFELENTYGSATNKKKFFRLDSSGTIQIINSAYTSNIFNLTDAGDLTVNKIIKSGGSETQILAADGTVITAGSGITISGGTISASAVGGVSSFNTRTGAITLTSGDVTTALGYTPLSSYTETDTLATVTGRGATTSTSITAKSGSTSASLSGFAFMGAGEFMTTGANSGYFWENRSGGVTSTSNWYGWYTNGGIIRLYNGSTDIVTIGGTNGNANFNGDLGIGTTAPNYVSSGRRVIDINGTSQSMLSLSVGGVGKGFLFHTGTDLLVSNEGNGAVKFNTNGSEKMRITSGGNVGIGTTSPRTRFSVVQDVDVSSITSGSMTAGISLLATSGIYGLNIATSNSTGTTFIQNHRNDGNTTVYPISINPNGGNVGIGTTSPLTKLHIEGDNSSTTDETLLTLRGSGENGKRIDFRNEFGSLARITGTKLAGGASANEGILTFETATNSVLSEKMRITDLGNVGIGTPSGISGKLTISSSSGDQIKLDRTGQTSRGIVISGSDNLSIGTWADPTQISINPLGNVGIGTTSPASKLQIEGTGIGAWLTINRTDSGTNLVDFTQSGTRLGYFGYIGNDFYLQNATNSNTLFSTNNTERMRITSGGNVGIGTTTDAGFRLDVNGTARVQGALTATADSTINGVNIGLGGGAMNTNTRVGLTALASNTTGTSNSAFGNGSLFSNTTGSLNTALGRVALNFNTTGANNTSVGHGSLYNNISGSDNVAIGTQAGRYIANGSTSNTITNSSIFIGQGTKALADNQSNQIVIGNNATGLGSNSTVLGNSSTTTTAIYGDLGIGTTSSISQAIRLGGYNAAGGRLYFQYAGDSSYIDAYGGHGGSERYRDLQIVGRNLNLTSSGGNVNANGSQVVTNNGGTWGINITGNAGTASQIYQDNEPTSGTYRLLLGNASDTTGYAYNFNSLYFNSANSTIQGANISGNAATATNLVNGGGIASGSGSRYITVDSTDGWSFLRFSKSGNCIWDIAQFNGGNLEFRPAGSGTNAVTISSGGVVSATSFSGAATLSSLSSNDGMIENNTGAYFHLGGWGVGRTAPTAILVNTAYRADIADNATYATSAGNADTVDGFHGDTFFRNLGFGSGYPSWNANTIDESRSGFTYANGAPHSGCIAHFGASGYGIQLNGNHNGDTFAMRSRNGDNGTWRPWKTLYTDYNMDAPNKSGTSYYQTNTWMQFNGSYGLYWPDTYGAHFAPNSTSSHTQFRLVGSKNSYGGIYDEYSAVNGIMYDSGGNGGIYREANGRWYLYHHVGNNCTGISTSSTSSSYRAYVGGSLYAEGDIVAYSDRRKKENIVTIDSALDKVNKLRGVYYNRIDDDTKKRQIGVIAQEIQEVLPEVVTYAKDVDEYGVSYGNIVGILIEAIKEQQKQIDDLKTKLTCQ